MRKTKNLKGFTLIEILIVIGLIAILAAVTIIALNPTASFQSARNSERSSELAQIHSGINRWVVEDDGSTANITHGVSDDALPACPGTILTTSGVDITTTSIWSALTTGGYVPTGIQDPTNANYRICQATNNQLSLFAPAADGDLVVVTR